MSYYIRYSMYFLIFVLVYATDLSWLHNSEHVYGVCWCIAIGQWRWGIVQVVHLDGDMSLCILLYCLFTVFSEVNEDVRVQIRGFLPLRIQCRGAGLHMDDWCTYSFLVSYTKSWQIVVHVYLPSWWRSPRLMLGSK